MKFLCEEVLREHVHDMYESLLTDDHSIDKSDEVDSIIMDFMYTKKNQNGEVDQMVREFNSKRGGVPMSAFPYIAIADEDSLEYMRKIIKRFI